MALRRSSHGGATGAAAGFSRSTSSACPVCDVFSDGRVPLVIWCQRAQLQST